MPKQKRTIKANDLTRDLRSGMTLSQLMNKYKISLKTLRFIFRELLNARAITKTELTAQEGLYKDTGDLKGVRKRLRRSTSIPVRIYDSSSPFATGHVINISEQGVCVKGIVASVGEVKNLIVRPGAFGQDHAFVFEGKCRWVNRQQLSDKNWLAGFEITSISSLDSKELLRLIHRIERHDLKVNKSLNSGNGRE